MQQSTPYLSFRGIGKTFPGVKALTDISFDCYAGQVHALMGENGAGKSTLLKILSGNYAPTTGSLTIRGQEVSFADTTAALNAGIEAIARRDFSQYQWTYKRYTLRPPGSGEANPYLDLYR